MLDASTIDLFHHNRVKPTIDKVTLCGTSSKDILQDDLEMLVAENGKNQYLYEHYESSRFMSFARLIKIAYKHYYDNGTHEVFTMAIKIGFNGMNMCGTLEEQRMFQIEFNPNKFVVPDWLALYFLKRDYTVSHVKNIDLAFDFMGFSKRYFRYSLNNGNVQTASIGTLGNKTDYIGFANKSKNRIKIYDKKKERQKYYTIDLETTRVEITLEYRHDFTNKYVCSDSAKLLDSAINALEQIFIADEIGNNPFVYALSCLSPYEFETALALMSQHTRKKYKQLCKEKSAYQLRCDFTDLVFFLSDALEKILYDNCIVHNDSLKFNEKEYDKYVYANIETVLPKN